MKIQLSPIELSPIADALSKARQQIEGTTRDMEIATRAMLVVEELIANSLHHGQATTCILGTFDESGTLHVEYRDDGLPFNPLAPRPVVKREIGGVGLGMIQELPDKALYLEGEQRLVLAFSDQTETPQWHQ